MKDNLAVVRGKNKTSPLPWFRFYTEALDDPKVQRLPPHLFKTWVNLLCLASQNNGDLPSLDDIAFRLRLSAQDAEQQISELVLAGLIDITPHGRTPHNWSKRQYVSDNSTDRVRKHRQKKAETPCNVSETASETTPEQSRADTDQSRTDQNPREREDDLPSVVKPVTDWRTAFASPDSHAGIEVADGTVRLLNGTRKDWLEKFGGDATALDLALIEVASTLQPASHTPLTAQVNRKLASIARDKHDKDQRYTKAAERNARKPAAIRSDGKPSMMEILKSGSAQEARQ